MILIERGVKMELLKASDLRKIFVKWSHGTLYNRLESLEIKDNPLFTVKNETTGIVQYNHNAIDVLKEQYLKEFTSTTKEEIDKVIFDYLSSKSNADVTRDKEPKTQKENLKNDTNDTNDNVDNGESVSSLKKQVELLQKQLDIANATNEKLLNTIMFREQKDALIEKQKLEKLEDIKLIAETGEHQDQEKLEQKKGVIAWFKDFKRYI